MSENIFREAMKTILNGDEEKASDAYAQDATDGVRKINALLSAK